MDTSQPAVGFRDTRRAWWGLAAVLPGVLAFLIVVGPRVLQPRNIAWLVEPDPAMEYLGWAFYRHTSWTLPIGANASYGLELGSGILYSDSIPLVAMLAKTFSAILPQPFQYFGYWLLACFVLQSVFAWKLAGLARAPPLVRMIAASWLVFAPPLLFRINMGHFGLVGHWTILAALWLYLRPRQRSAAAWTALVVATALIHTYLFAMVAALWGASLAARFTPTRSRVLATLVEVAVTVGLSVVALWQAGLFLIESGRNREGFGIYSLNVLSPFNPMGWSRLLPTLPGHDGDYEGYAFLGLGGLVLLILAVVAVARLRAAGALVAPQQIWPLLVAICGLCVYALSNQVSVGSWSVTYPLPDPVIQLLSTLRGSGRLVWPAFYGLLAWCLVLVTRAWRPRTAAILLSTLLVVQLVDLSPGCRPLRDKLSVAPKTRWDTPLADPFWEEAAKRYTTVRRYPPRVRDGWEIWASFAALHGLATDAAYLTRIDNVRRDDLDAREIDALSHGRVDSSTLYILPNGLADEMRCVVDPRVDRLDHVDGFSVLAPGWYRDHPVPPPDRRGCLASGGQ